MKKIIIAIILFSSGVFSLYGQSDVLLSQQLFNRMNINPAATGNSQDINLFFLDREQWLGYNGRPSTQLFNGHYFMESINSGIGLSFEHDHKGYSRSINVKAAYAYHVWFGELSYLSLGLSAGILNKSVNLDDAITEELNDPGLSELDGDSKVNPDFDFGMEYNWKDLTIGASCTHISMSNNSASVLNSTRHFYAYAKYRFHLTETFDLSPSVMYNNSQSVNMFDFNVLGTFMKRYWLGLTYRSNVNITDDMAFIGMLGLEIFDGLRVGYSYDFNTGSIGEYAGGSHEFMLYWKIKTEKSSKYARRTPRFIED